MNASETRDALRKIQAAAREIDMKAARAHSLIIKDQPIDKQLYEMLIYLADINDEINKLNADQQA